MHGLYLIVAGLGVAADGFSGIAALVHFAPIAERSLVAEFDTRAVPAR